MAEASDRGGPKIFIKYGRTISTEWIFKKMGKQLVLYEDEDAWAGFEFDLDWAREFWAHGVTLNGSLHCVLIALLIKLWRLPATDSSSSSMVVAGATETLAVFWHEGMLAHDAGSGMFDTGLDPGFLDVLEKHFDGADRVRNMVSILRRGPIAPFLSWHSGSPAHTSDLLKFHTQEYIDELVQADASGGKKLDKTTFLNPGSWDATLLAAGTTLSAARHILDGRGKMAYALVRPPGHHAHPDRADGYCILNNAGLALQLALDSGLTEIAVVDIDAHYGNGTAERFYQTDNVLTISLHMKHGSWDPSYSHAQSGSADLIGEGKGLGYNLNIPLPNGSGDAGYEYAVNELVVPAIDKFQPQLLVFVIGQDSSAFDPLARQCLTMEGYRRIGKIMRSMANRHSDGKILIVQEGGYNISYSAYCLHATLEGVLNLEAPLLDDPIAFYPEDEKYTVKEVDVLKKFWRESIPFLKDI
ncbi:histone deacetylase 8-like [Lolium rigidum]|uniref:histone deacetylase 8-like n=1 Tax=Lolium rigidum TaxID=89674 RepID=UPI001F5D5163|nr:histone deacetylase 8-like [Lolium rigidum]